MSVNLSYIKPKHSLHTACQKSQLCDAIITKVLSIADYEAHKSNNELLIFIMNCVENTVSSKAVNKKVLVIEIFSKLFPTTSQEELNILGESIDFICNNNLIKKINVVTKYTSIFSNYIKTKFWPKYRLTYYNLGLGLMNNTISQIVQTYFQQFVAYILVSKLGFNIVFVAGVLLIL